MSRGTLTAAQKAGSSSILDAVKSLADYGILAVRRKRNGEILEVKTALWGWIPANVYAFIEELHRLQPTIAKLVEGGYLAKAALYTQNIGVQVAGQGFAIPLGVMIVTLSIGQAVVDHSQGNETAAILDLLALVLPFGEIYTIWRLGELLYPGASAVARDVGSDLGRVAGLLSELFSPLGAGTVAVTQELTALLHGL